MRRLVPNLRYQQIRRGGARFRTASRSERVCHLPLHSFYKGMLFTQSGTPYRRRVRAASGQGSTAVMFRLGTCPTGMRAISFLNAMSTADTELDAALAT